MSKYEKIASIIIGILVIIMITYSLLEITEMDKEHEEHEEHKEHKEHEKHEEHENSDFDKSFGEEFKMGEFTIIVSEESSSQKEENCEIEEIVIASLLHDINDKLTKDKDEKNTFEINDHTIDVFCNTTAQIVLANTDGEQLILKKKPFTRAIPEGANAEDEGNEIRINATIVPPGEEIPTEPTVSGYVLFPDRYLDVISPEL